MSQWTESEKVGGLSEFQQWEAVDNYLSQVWVAARNAEVKAGRTPAQADQAVTQARRAWVITQMQRKGVLESLPPISHPKGAAHGVE
jgi:hypothetical protein